MTNNRSLPSKAGSCLRLVDLPSCLAVLLARVMILATLLASFGPLLAHASDDADNPSVAEQTELVASASGGTIYAAPDDDGASFSNAELRSDAADPCIIKVGDTYYLFATTGDLGLPYYSSTDFKNWTYAGNALSTSAFEGTGLTRGDIWAPEVRERTVRGRTTYVLTYTAADYWDGEYRICVSEASTIAPGAFGNPKTIDTGSVHNAIDSNLFFEGDDIWLYFKNEDEYHTICVERLGADWSRISGPTVALSMDQAWETWTIEGPWMLKCGSTYYLMYSSGGYTTSNYCVGYATSSSPAGPFTKVTTTVPLVRTQLDVKGPGHNTTLMAADGEIYLVYHSLHEVGKPDRRLMVDRMGIDDQGRMFVNFSGFGRQPLPSGADGYFQIGADDFRVLARGVESIALSDVVNGLSDDVAVETVDVSSLDIEVEDGYHVSDVWLFGTNRGLSGTADIVVNGSLVLGGYRLSGASTKLTLPGTKEYIRSIEVRMSATQSLSEVLLVSYGERWSAASNREGPVALTGWYSPEGEDAFYWYENGVRRTTEGWVVTDQSPLGTASGLERYWLGEGGVLARGRMVDPAEGSDAWLAYASDEGAVARGALRVGDRVYLADNDGRLADPGWVVSADFGQGLQRYYVDAATRSAKIGYSNEGWPHYTTGEGYVLRGALRVGNGVYLADNDGRLADPGWVVSADFGQGLQRYYVDASTRKALVGYSEAGWPHYTTDAGYVLRGELRVGSTLYEANNDGLITRVAS